MNDDDVVTVMAVVIDAGCYSVVVVVVEETSLASDMNSSLRLVSAGLSVVAAASCGPLSCGRS